MHIGIIECGRNLPEWVEVHGGFADWFPNLLLPVDPSFSFSVFAADLGVLPDDIFACDAWLLTGSPVSVNDRMPWQAALDAFIRRTYNQVPMVGICYGHQHMHDALGGAVGKCSKWGVGIQSYTLSADPPEWLDHPNEQQSADNLRLIALHQDEVTVPAPGTKILAGNAGCPLGITQIGDHVLTFQAHPEMTTDQVTLIYDLHRQSIGEADWKNAQDSLSGPIDAERAARWIAHFLRARTADRISRKDVS